MKFYIILFFICLELCSPNQTTAINKEVKRYKLLSMFQTTDLIQKPDDKLTQFNYKNIVLSENEIQVYLSPSDNNPVNII
jgi:hypothetical protein